MSYDIQTKKRRFERILDSLTDGSSDSNHASPRLNGSATSKRRRLASAATTTTASLTTHYLPSSRTAFLERLATFRHVTKWHISSTEKVNASVWAKRGWICDDSDTVFCGSCNQRLHVDLNVDDDPGAGASSEEQQQQHQHQHQQQQDPAEDTFALRADIHDGLVKKYLDLVVDAHAQSCPWRKRGCDGSIQRIEGLLNTYKTVQGVKTRYEGLLPSIQQVPTVGQLPNVNETEMREFRFNDNDDDDSELGQLSQDLLRLAACGWQKKTDDVIECRYCFRSLGLWLYRGEGRMIDQLDPLDSHLEYCPWISPEAQDTEITLYQHTNSADSSSEPTTHKYAGWELVYQAVTKDNAKRRRRRTGTGTDTESTPNLTPMPTPDTLEVNGGNPSATVLSNPTSESLNNEQQEKRRLDLMRRIKELKKPFTAVKSFLPGKKKSLQPS